MAKNGGGGSIQKAKEKFIVGFGLLLLEKLAEVDWNEAELIAKDVLSKPTISRLVDDNVGYKTVMKLVALIPEFSIQDILKHVDINDI